MMPPDTMDSSDAGQKIRLKLPENFARGIPA
jgi:hypothetical protein